MMSSKLRSVVGRRRSAKAGYSLLEILIVLAIIALIAALVGPRLFAQFDKSKVTAARVQVKQLASAVETMRLDIGRYPTASEGLALLNAAPSGAVANWSGPYLAGGRADGPLGPRLRLPAARGRGAGAQGGQLRLGRAPRRLRLRRRRRELMHVRSSSRAGFSMLEMVIALAILSMTAALVVTRASVMLDQIAVHTAFQQFQTGLLSLRDRAFGRSEDLTAAAADLPVPEGWSLHSEAPLTARADGRCTGGPVELMRAGRVRARLVPAGDGCRYLRAS